VTISKTQIDRLGERLRTGEPTDTDLRELDRYRRSCRPAYDEVVRRIRADLNVTPSGRPEKTTLSIIDKLRRESIRLTQMQDVAGCRIVVPNTADQDRVVDGLRRCFPTHRVEDRRRKPSYGYRAVHVIIREHDRAVEIQVRTAWQHLWAQYSENLSDWVDPTIKYGGGPKAIVEGLLRASELIARIESGQLEQASVIDLIDVFLLLLGGIMRK